MAGESVMTLGRRMPYAGSLAEQAVQSGQPAIIERIAEADERLPPDLVTACADCSAAVVPLDGSGEPIVMVALPSASRSARTGTRPDRGAWAAVHVTDTGPGISSEQVKHLFEEFRRLETAGETTGAGIGLAISRTLARVLGGDITVDSKVGQGSTFTLWLPLDQRTESQATNSSQG